MSVELSNAQIFDLPYRSFLFDNQDIGSLILRHPSAHKLESWQINNIFGCTITREWNSFADFLVMLTQAKYLGDYVIYTHLVPCIVKNRPHIAQVLIQLPLAKDFYQSHLDRCLDLVVLYGDTKEWAEIYKQLLTYIRPETSNIFFKERVGDLYGAIQENKLFMCNFLLDFYQKAITNEKFKDLFKYALERNRDLFVSMLLSHPCAVVCDQSELESLVNWYRRPLTLNDFLSKKEELGAENT